MGDHGVMLKHGLHTEGVIRMPFIWADPQAKGGMRTEQLSSAIDFTPSVLGRAGLQPFSGVQGVDIVSVARNKSELDRTGIIIEADELPENVNVEKFFRVRSFVDGRWRMTLWVDDDFGEMYDRENDPHELENLWDNSQHKETKSRLLELMLKEQYRYSELMPRPIYMG